MYQMCQHGKQDGEPCEECSQIIASKNKLAAVLKKALKATAYPGGMAKNIREADSEFNNIYEFELQSVETRDIGNEEVAVTAVYKKVREEKFEID